MTLAMGIGEKIKALGVPEGHQCELLTFLIKNEDDYKEFVHEFFTGEIVRDIAKYQLHKRQQNKMTLDEFLTMFKVDEKNALEQLCQEPLNNRYVEYLVVYNVTPQSLYKRFTNNSNRSYLSLVKDTNEYVKGFSDDFLLTT